MYVVSTMAMLSLKPGPQRIRSQTLSLCISNMSNNPMDLLSPNGRAHYFLAGFSMREHDAVRLAFPFPTRSVTEDFHCFFTLPLDRKLSMTANAPGASMLSLRNVRTIGMEVNVPSSMDSSTSGRPSRFQPHDHGQNKKARVQRLSMRAGSAMTIMGDRSIHQHLLMKLVSGRYIEGRAQPTRRE